MTYNINLQHLKVVAAIEKEGSMTKAADALFLTQSALSHHVKELERIIGH
jgi:LysR family transcriptional regulator, regulator for metE and metH